MSSFVRSSITDHWSLDLLLEPTRAPIPCIQPRVPVLGLEPVGRCNHPFIFWIRQQPHDSSNSSTLGMCYLFWHFHDTVTYQGNQKYPDFKTFGSPCRVTLSSPMFITEGQNTDSRAERGLCLHRCTLPSVPLRCSESLSDGHCFRTGVEEEKFCQLTDGPCDYLYFCPDDNLCGFVFGG